MQKRTKKIIAGLLALSMAVAVVPYEAVPGIGAGFGIVANAIENGNEIHASQLSVGAVLHDGDVITVPAGTNFNINIGEVSTSSFVGPYREDTNPIIVTVSISDGKVTFTPHEYPSQAVSVDLPANTVENWYTLDSVVITDLSTTAYVVNPSTAYPNVTRVTDILIGGIRANRAYYGAIPDTEYTDKTYAVGNNDTREFNLQTSLLPGDILLPGAKLSQTGYHDSVYYRNVFGTKDFDCVADDGDIYDTDAAGEYWDKVHSLAAGCNGYKVRNVVSTYALRGNENCVESDFELEDTAYETPSYEVNGSTFNVTSPISSAATDPVQNGIIWTIHYNVPLRVTSEGPGNVKIGNSRSPLDFDAQTNEYYLDIPASQNTKDNKIEALESCTVYFDNSFLAGSDGLKTGDLIIPRTAFANTSTTEYRFADFNETIIGVAQFHEDGSITITPPDDDESSGDIETTYKLPADCNAWLCDTVTKPGVLTLTGYNYAGLENEIIPLYSEVSNQNYFLFYTERNPAPLIKLNADIVLTRPITFHKDTIIDLNGHTLSWTGQAAGNTVNINGHTVVFKNGTLSTDARYPLLTGYTDSGSFLYLDNVKLTRTESNSEYALIAADNGSSLYVYTNGRIPSTFFAKQYLISAAGTGTVRLAKSGEIANLEQRYIDGHLGTPAGIDGREVYTIQQHQWSEPTYTWSDDCTVCTATRTCALLNNETETEKAVITNVVTQPTETSTGSIKYTATFTNPAFATQEKTVTIQQTAIDWDDPVYTWDDSGDTMKCTMIQKSKAYTTDHIAISRTVPAVLTSGYVYKAEFDIDDAEIQEYRDDWTAVNTLSDLRAAAQNPNATKIYLTQSLERGNSSDSYDFNHDAVIDMNGFSFDCSTSAGFGFSQDNVTVTFFDSAANTKNDTEIHTSTNYIRTSKNPVFSAVNGRKGVQVNLLGVSIKGENASALIQSGDESGTAPYVGQISVYAESGAKLTNTGEGKLIAVYGKDNNDVEAEVKFATADPFTNDNVTGKIVKTEKDEYIEGTLYTVKSSSYITLTKAAYEHVSDISKFVVSETDTTDAFPLFPLTYYEADRPETIYWQGYAENGYYIKRVYVTDANGETDAVCSATDPTIYYFSTGASDMVFHVETAALESVNYIDNDGKAQTAENVTALTGREKILKDGWYVVSDDIIFKDKVDVQGDVNIIVADGKTVTFASKNGGLYGSWVDAETSAARGIHIYGQEEGTGTVLAGPDKNDRNQPVYMIDSYYPTTISGVKISGGQGTDGVMNSGNILVYNSDLSIYNAEIYLKSLVKGTTNNINYYGGKLHVEEYIGSTKGTMNLEWKKKDSDSVYFGTASGEVKFVNAFKHAASGTTYAADTTVNGSELNDKLIKPAAAADVITLTGASMDLNGALELMFYFDIPDSLTGTYTAVMEGPDKQGKTAITELELTKKTTYGYVATYPIMAVDADQKVTISVKDANDNTVPLYYSNGTEIEGDSYTYGVYDYVENALSYLKDTQLKAKVKAMYTYAAYAVKWNKGTAVPSDVNELSDASAVTGNDSFKLTKNGTSDKYTIKTISLVFDSETAFKLYFTCDGAPGTITLDGTAVTPVKSGSRYYVKLSNIGAKELQTKHILAFEDGYSATFSPMSYLYVKLGNTSTDEALADLLRATYDYSEAFK
ncbi:MAG: hypothetical protein IKP75_07205 [Oscillospiraceae bacterium]|nr:hypothetical protein [Oscillospiraceae bacterium]